MARVHPADSPAALLTAKMADAAPQGSGTGTGTTATSSLSVTAHSQNGSLFPTDQQHPAAPQAQPAPAPAPAPAPLAQLPPPVPSPTTATPPQPLNPQAVPRRSRSRTTHRRVSGSTVASSSPASINMREPKKPVKGIIGVCALESKARSKPARNIFGKLVEDFEVKIFGDKIILDEEVENWPVCDFLISFFSDGFPLDKAIAYVRLRKPFCVNDLPMQQVLWDRRLCLSILDKLNVPTPKRIEVNRDGGPKLPSADFAKLKPRLDEHEQITYFAGNAAGDFEAKQEDGVNPVTWGTFAGKEIVTPTIIEAVSFRSWRDEAFSIWKEWQRIYPTKSATGKLLRETRNDVWLVNVIWGDYVEGDGLWEFLGA